VNVIPESYGKVLGQDISACRIAMVEEGFKLPNSDPRVNLELENAAATLTGLGAIVEKVSIPFHALGGAIFLPIAVMNFYELMAGNPYVLQEGLHLDSLLQMIGKWHDRADEIPANVKIMMTLGQYMRAQKYDSVYAKAMNLSRSLKAAYDQVLEQYDLLLMPTIPIVPPALPGPNPSVAEVFAGAMAALGNTAQFNLTGHPSLSMPCGIIDDLPIGMMLTGKHFDEMMIYRVAHAFERAT